MINVESIQSTDVDVFATLDSLISALDAPSAGDPVATARLNNELATANKKLASNYDNVLTVNASVGARMNGWKRWTRQGRRRG